MTKPPIHPNAIILHEGDKINLEDAPRFVQAMQHLFNALWEQQKPEEPQTKEGA